jgi:hypothetical protein
VDYDHNRAETEFKSDKLNRPRKGILVSYRASTFRRSVAFWRRAIEWLPSHLLIDLIPDSAATELRLKEEIPDAFISGATFSQEQIL